MSTRACIKIKESSYANEQDMRQDKKTAMYITLYHHSDGYPDGVGSDLLEFLRGRNDWEFDEPMWDAEKIATDLIRGEVLTNGVCGNEPTDVHRDMGYVPAVCCHGDCVYGYLIDCDNRTLTCYEIYPDRHPEWREKDIVEIPDKWKDVELRLPQTRDFKVRFHSDRLDKDFECKVEYELNGEVDGNLWKVYDINGKSEDDLEIDIYGIGVSHYGEPKKSRMQVVINHDDHYIERIEEGIKVINIEEE